MRRAASERGIAVLVVLVVLAIGALAGTVALLAARSAGEAAMVSAGRLQSRLTMRSGVLALGQMARDQRGDVLGGAEFVVDDPVELFTEGNRTAVFRLDGRMTETPVSLDALLDVNTADAEMLAKLPGMDETLADAMAGALPVRSLRELLEVERVTVELLYGEYDEFGRLISQDAPLASLLTVGSGEPAISIGVGGATPTAERVDVSKSLTEEAAERLGELLDPQEGSNQLVAALRQMDSPPASLGGVARALRASGQTLATAGQALDTVCIGAGPARGRVDINRAPFEVLAVLPGLDEESAQGIVDARRSLSAEELTDPLWPLREGLVDEEGMLEAVDRITTRSVRWVLRAEAGMVTVRERSVGIDSLEDAQRARAGMAGDDQEKLADRVAMDYLVDFSGDRPVVVPLGEVSIAGELAAVARVLADAREAEGDFGLAPEPAPETGGRP